MRPQLDLGQILARNFTGSTCKYLGVEVINNTGINKQALSGNNSERGTGQNRAADALLAWIVLGGGAISTGDTILY